MFYVQTIPKDPELWWLLVWTVWQWIYPCSINIWWCYPCLNAQHHFWTQSSIDVSIISSYPNVWLLGVVKSDHFDVVFNSDNNENGGGFYATYDVYTGGQTPPTTAPALPDSGLLIHLYWFFVLNRPCTEILVIFICIGIKQNTVFFCRSLQSNERFLNAHLKQCFVIRIMEQSSRQRKESRIHNIKKWSN